MKNRITNSKLILLLFLLLSSTVYKTYGGGGSNCTITGEPSFCTGSSTNLCVPIGATSYFWSKNGTSLGINSNCITASAPGTYSVFITNAVGPSMSCAVLVTENPLPDFTVNSQLNLPCGTTQTNLNIVLNTQASVNYSTTVDNNFGNVNSGGTSSTPNVAVPGNYNVVVTNQNTGCSASQFVATGTLGGICIFCNQNVVTVSSDITINFNTTPATYTGDPALIPFFSEDRTGGATPDKWKAIFNMGGNKLLITNNAIIKTKKVNKYAPGMDFRGLCDFSIETGAQIYAEGDNKNSGDLIFQFNGNIYVAGTIRNEVTDNDGIPGQIVLATKCGDINVAETGLVTAIGEDKGGNDVSLLACGEGCFPINVNKSVAGIPVQGYSGNINVAGLVSSFAEASAGNQSLHRPNVKVVSFNGSVNIYAISYEPLYDEFSRHGIKYDLWGGLLSWTDKNAKPGKVEVQARGSILVEGHGTDPTGAVRKSFGAIAAVGVGPSTTGGLVDVRSLEGRIEASDRAFDVSGKNRLFTNVARIKLHARADIILTRVGVNNNFNPVLDARSVVGGRGGTNDIRSYMGGIQIGATARVLASTPAGGGSVQGVNLLEACLSVGNNGTVTPADLIPGNDNGSCSQNFPPAIYETCWQFPVKIGVRLAEEEEQISQPDLNVYPNPTEGRITMQFNSTSAERYRITVISMTGTIVLDKQYDAKEGNNTEEIDLSNVSKGMYILMLSGKDMKEQKRITLQ